MSITKKRLKSGKLSWGYLFSVGPRAVRRQFKESGFATKDAAQNAEATARLEAAKQPVPTANPKTLGEVLVSFIEDRRAELSPKTVDRYSELWPYLSAELLARPVHEVTALMLHSEWKRLHAAGGHTRKDKTPRPLSPKTVRNIAGLVSASFGWAILYGLVEVNPATASKPPRGGATRKAVALAPSTQDVVIESATGPWCLGAFLEVCAGLGARRGEVLALRWSDIQGGHAHIGRSLCQVGPELSWKSTKGGKPRIIEIPARTLDALEQHRQQQAAFRQQFGTDYAAGDLIFATPEGEPLRPDSVSSAVSALCRRLKLPRGASLHALRHSHGSQLLKSGVPLAEVSARLGHANPSTTLAIYTHEIPGSGEAAKVWNDMQEPKGKEKRQ